MSPTILIVLPRRFFVLFLSDFCTPLSQYLLTSTTQEEYTRTLAYPIYIFFVRPLVLANRNLSLKYEYTVSSVCS